MLNEFVIDETTGFPKLPGSYYWDVSSQGELSIRKNIPDGYNPIPADGRGKFEGLPIVDGKFKVERRQTKLLWIEKLTNRWGLTDDKDYYEVETNVLESGYIEIVRRLIRFVGGEAKLEFSIAACLLALNTHQEELKNQAKADETLKALQGTYPPDKLSVPVDLNKVAEELIQMIKNEKEHLNGN